MKETDHLRNLMESMPSIVADIDDKEAEKYYDDYEWGKVVVYDSKASELKEYNFKNELDYARFNNKYGFDADSIYDFPVKRGVRTFQLGNRIVIVSPSMQALAAEVEAHQ